MNKNKTLRILWKLLLISQLPLYILLIILVSSFITGNKESSEGINQFTVILTQSFFVAFCISCLISISTLLLLNRNDKKAFAFSITASVILTAGLYILYYYGAHLLFIVIPFVVVLYHALMFSSYSRIFIPESQSV